MKLENTNTVDIAVELNTIKVDAGSVTLGRVLTLLAVVPHADDVEDAIATAATTSRAHPCRVVVIVHDEQAEASCDSRLDAEIRVGEDEGASEVVVLYPKGGACEDLDTLVMPLLLADTPVVVWWPEDGPDSPQEHPLGNLATRRITDSRRNDNPVDYLERLALNYHPGDTDLAWAGITLWRALAVTLVQERPHGEITAAKVRGNLDQPAMHLMAGWLAVQLDISVELEAVDGARTLTEVVLQRADGELIISRPDGESVATLSHPNRQDQRVNLPRRSVADCLTEDLRRLDPDDMYAQVVTRGIAMVER